MAPRRIRADPAVCRQFAWHLPLNHGDNRPVAWTGGVLNENSCEWEDLNVWTAWSDVQPGTAVVALLDGDDGSVIQQVPIPDLPQPWPGWYGFYGAAASSAAAVSAATSPPGVSSTAKAA